MSDDIPAWPNDVPLERQENCLAYLDELRDSAITNMFGAGPYLGDWYKNEYGEPIGRQVAQSVLVYWMNTYGERHKA